MQRYRKTHNYIIIPVRQASSKLNFKLDEEPNKLNELNIFDRDGRLVLTRNFTSSEFSIEILNLTPGEYLYRITGDRPKVYSGIFLVVN